MLTFLVELTILLSVLSAFIPFIFKRWPLFIKYSHFILLGLSGLSAIVTGFITLLTQQSILLKLPLGFLSFTGSMHLDVLSGFFLMVIGMIVFSVAIYGPHYLRSYESSKQSILFLTFFTSLFVVGMYLVVLANDVFSFMFSWELMSLSSYFLVVYHHDHAENRRAGLVYLLMAHISGLLILLAFGILVKVGGSLNFEVMKTVNLTPYELNLAFILAFLGFGMKSGIIPFHVWLPQAHPVAPSHVSALMSGVMLKVAIYGFIRFVFVLLHYFNWKWGVWVLCAGSLSAILGVLYALMQHDLKRLLAYHSIENIGIIFIGLGLSIIFISEGHPILGTIGLIAALYHCLNHALFKSLLFFGAGAVLQHTHEHDLEHMGGLIHRMPQVAFFFLIGCLSISALPPFNGFVSEWLTFQSALQATALHSAVMRIFIPISAAILALTSALAAACFVKVYGIAFLGQARTRHVRKANRPGFGMRFSMGLLASLCLLFGLLPTFTIYFINTIPIAIGQLSLPTVTLNHWLWLVPISFHRSAYSAISVFLGIATIGSCIYLFTRFFKKYSFKKAIPWGCGFGELDSRMQYTSTAFAMPIRRVFQGVWKIEEKNISEPLEGQTSSSIRYELHVSDWFWTIIYEPLEHYFSRITKLLSHIQGGNIRVYLAYTFFTLLLLLWVIL